MEGLSRFREETMSHFDDVKSQLSTITAILQELSNKKKSFVEDPDLAFVEKIEEIETMDDCITLNENVLGISIFTDDYLSHDQQQHFQLFDEVDCEDLISSCANGQAVNDFTNVEIYPDPWEQRCIEATRIIQEQFSSSVEVEETIWGSFGAFYIVENKVFDGMPHPISVDINDHHKVDDILDEATDIEEVDKIEELAIVENDSTGNGKFGVTRVFISPFVCMPRDLDFRRDGNVLVSSNDYQQSVKHQKNDLFSNGLLIFDPRGWCVLNFSRRGDPISTGMLPRAFGNWELRWTTWHGITFSCSVTRIVFNIFFHGCEKGYLNLQLPFTFSNTLLYNLCSLAIYVSSVLCLLGKKIYQLVCLLQSFKSFEVRGVLDAEGFSTNGVVDVGSYSIGSLNLPLTNSFAEHAISIDVIFLSYPSESNYISLYEVLSSFYGDSAAKRELSQLVQSQKAKILKVKLLMATKYYFGAIYETGYLLKGNDDDFEALLLRVHAYYHLVDHDVALKHFQKGLRLDLGHTKLKKAYFGLKNLLKKAKSAVDNVNKGKFRVAVEEYRAALAIVPNHTTHNVHVHLGLCQVLVKLGRGNDAVDSCSEALETGEELVESLSQRGEAELLIEDWEGAVADLKLVAEKSPHDRSIHERLMKAEKSLKLSERKDWYKILGVSKTASISEIKKACIKLAWQWHPDMNVDSREEVEAKFREIAGAYEIHSEGNEFFQLSFNALTGQVSSNTIRIQGLLKRKPISILIDSGASHIFWNRCLAKELNCVEESTYPLYVTVADGERMCSDSKCPNFPWVMSGHKLHHDVRLLKLVGCDMVWGVDWMRKFSSMVFYFNQLQLSFKEGEEVLFKGQGSKAQLKLMSCRSLKKSIKKGACGLIGCLYSMSTFELPSMTIHSSIHEVLLSYQDTFKEPTELPPYRDCKGFSFYVCLSAWGPLFRENANATYAEAHALHMVAIMEYFVWDPGIVMCLIHILEDKDILKGKVMSRTRKSLQIFKLSEPRE